MDDPDRGIADYCRGVLVGARPDLTVRQEGTGTPGGSLGGASRRPERIQGRAAGSGIRRAHRHPPMFRVRASHRGRPGSLEDGRTHTLSMLHVVREALQGSVPPAEGGCDERVHGALAPNGSRRAPTGTSPPRYLKSPALLRRAAVSGEIPVPWPAPLEAGGRA